jgi:hypothetical protein
MRTLARLSTEPSYKSSRDAIGSAFDMIRHYIGRLGHHLQAAEILVACAPRLMNLLHDFEVHRVPVLVKSAMPPPDHLTRAENILVRMLPAQSSELEHYQQVFADMNSRYQVFNRFLQNYAKPDQNSCVHAEVQVLEHFYAHKMDFVEGDSYVACSKPACFCCLLYFRHHPGHIVTPVSHNKIYLNWRPPDFCTSTGILGPNHLRDILNHMNQEIRKEALRQIHGQIAPKAWHPDSITGITESAQGKGVGGPMNELDLTMCMANGTYTSRGCPQISPASEAPTASLCQALKMQRDKTAIQPGSTSVTVMKEMSPLSESFPEQLISDSDESGGIQL